MHSKAVFLDRDHTLVECDGDLADPADVRLIKGAASAIASLRGLGFKIIVVSNQSGVARGVMSEEDVDAVNQRIAETVQQITRAPIDRFYYCPFHPRAKVKRYRKEHPWRKPAPGMLVQAAEDFDLDLEQCWIVGSQRSDVAAGHAAGVRTVLLRPLDEEGEPASPPEPEHDEGEGEADFEATSLVEAVRLIAQAPPPAREEPDEAPMLTSSTTNRERVSGASGASPRTVEPAGQASAATATVAEDEAEPEQADDDDGPVVTTPTRPLTTISGLSTPLRPVSIELDQATDESAEAGERGEAVDEAPGAATEEAAAAPAVDGPEAAVAPQMPASAPSAPAPQPMAPVTAELDDRAIVEQLEKIHRELARQRADYGDFSWSKMVAVLAQMIAGGCVLFALMYVSAPMAFMQWISGGIFFQLVVVTLLVMQGER